ncbi:hypothetical protein CAMRE0001_0496 [Campylobacter rectus RM3267]|uniref:Uncharacterized protein n=1 Tax=Campylobacter rectus RM3267 TaxID=553218 RepID=B9D2X4_CAMRE|nr:hypothetical protein CAMRE0001_0496 [Campylobacter rectus RM3267]
MRVGVRQILKFKYRIFKFKPIYIGGKFNFTLTKQNKPAFLACSIFYNFKPVWV